MYASLGHLAGDFCMALYRLDTLKLKYVAGRFVLLVGTAAGHWPTCTYTYGSPLTLNFDYEYIYKIRFK